MKPYALLGAGMYATSLGTNPEAGATEATHFKNGLGLGLHVGVGLEWSVNRTQMFTEWRYQQALHQTRGAAFMPLVVGVKFQPWGPASPRLFGPAAEAPVVRQPL